MSKGENIFRRKDGRWEARYVKGYDLSGKIKYGFCYGKTYKEAKEKVEKCKTDALAANRVVGKESRHKFYYYCDEWLRTRKNRLKESTYVKYDTILEKHIKPKMGSCAPAAINNELIEVFTDELLYQDMLSAKTVKDILIVLRSIFKYAAKQYPGMFLAVEIVYPKESKKEMRVLTRDEQERFVSYLLTDMDTCKFGILLALLTGLRIGEICALRWDAVDLKEQTIRVSATMQRLRNTEGEIESKTKIVIGTPKSDTSLRVIPMTDYAAELCGRMNPQCEAAFVLTGTEKYMEPRTLQYRLERYCREFGFEDVHFHTLRHTFATRCVEVGFEIKSLSEILGHATTTITLDRYVHSSIELKRNNMNKLTEIGY